MKIKDIINDSALLLGLNDSVEILNNDEKTELEKQEDANIKLLLNLSGYSIRELCTNYASVLSTATVQTTNQVYPISSLSNYIRINSVKKDGQAVKFKIVSRNIQVEEDGCYQIEYDSYPQITSLSDDVTFLQAFGSDIAVMGLCAYYCLSKGMFEDFEQFHAQYIGKAESLKDMKTFVMPQRRWE